MDVVDPEKLSLELNRISLRMDMIEMLLVGLVRQLPAISGKSADDSAREVLEKLSLKLQNHLLSSPEHAKLSPEQRAMYADEIHENVQILKSIIPRA